MMGIKVLHRKVMRDKLIWTGSVWHIWNNKCNI